MKKLLSIILTVSMLTALVITSGAEFLRGDVNGDGEVNNKDVVTLFRYVSGDDKVKEEDIYDYNRDGYADNKDVVALFRAATAGEHEHKWSEWKTVQEPTDDTAGVSRRVCALCGEEETKTIPALCALWVAHGQYLLADGTENQWGGKDQWLYEAAALDEISLGDVQAIDADLYNALCGKDVLCLYTIDLIFGTNDAGWTAKCIKDGVLYRANGSYCFKIAQCSSGVVDGVKEYYEDLWIPDPVTAYAESLTPNTLFIPVWREEEDENGLSWIHNPVVTGGPGLYTLVIAQYTNDSSEGNPGFGIGLVLKEAMEGIAYEEIKPYVPSEHTYGVIGSFEGSDWENEVAMTAAGDNTWTCEIELLAGNEFAVRADGQWEYMWGDGYGNAVVDTDGTYIITITFDERGNGTVTATLK